MVPRALFLLVAILCTSSLVVAHIETLTIREDERLLFLVDSFGFGPGGVIELDCSGFTVRSDSRTDGGGEILTAKPRVGFLLKDRSTDQIILEDQHLTAKDSCFLDDISTNSKSFEVKFPDNKATEGTLHVNHTFTEGGDFRILFVSCANHSNEFPLVDFDLALTMYNVNSDGSRNYLAIGEVMLPLFYAIVTIVFAALLFQWIVLIMKEREHVKSVHYLMALLVVVKICTVALETIRYSSIESSGSAPYWTTMYYLFDCVRGVMLFIVVLLIGSGWSFVKPFLSNDEKNLIMLVLSLQVVSNAALVLFEVELPGEKGRLTWRDIFYLLDMLCCISVLMPIVWSIRRLKAEAQDDAAQRHLQKLQLFREFYVICVVYIYFTRIVLLLFSFSLPYTIVWLKDLWKETCSVVFFTTIGYKFRPRADNPYLVIPQDEEAVSLRSTAVEFDHSSHSPSAAVPFGDNSHHSGSSAAGGIQLSAVASSSSSAKPYADV
eukprot:gnl/Spiro4/16546_TR8909_c0_g1_i1.p1 gnl/Spiro4/16546_TR8909_c0_g1~~gnl/Spiro4/16546_TR8909_c0_g1_i1.p1  ORF type:complete len:509 (+),score=144.39 gnl/Spiro4/16546_TR8909_c0_g1_i1:53-1528(+)